MPLSISLGFSTIILAFVDGTPIPSDLHRRFRLLADRISRASGVVVNPFRPRWCQSGDWHIVLGNTLRKSPDESTALGETFPRRFAGDFLSPVYYEANKAGWKDDVSLVLNTVCEHAYWRPNSTFGLHILVGLGGGQRFTLPQLKRIAMLVCRFEEAIDTFPPVRRMLSNKDFILSNRYNPAFRGRTLTEVYSLIQVATEIPELCALLNKRHKGKQAFPGYVDSEYFKVDFSTVATHSSIHFFQYESTVSAESAIKWAEFTLHFVEYAMSSSETIIMSGGNTIEDLARLVGLP